MQKSDFFERLKNWVDGVLSKTKYSTKIRYFYVLYVYLVDQIKNMLTYL